MSLDMKHNRRSTKSSQGSPLLLGIIIGALVGVAIAVGVALFLNRNSPFLNQEQAASTVKEASTIGTSNAVSQPEILHPDNNQVVDTIPVVNESQTASTPDTATQAIDYDFYKLLPGQHKESTESSAIAKRSTGINTDNKINSIKKIYLQIGAFQNEQQADNLKAKLALLGLEAQIQSKDHNGTIIHRVRVGPFNSQEELNRMRTQLQKNGINGTIVN